MSNSFTTTDATLVASEITYGTVNGGDIYFSKRLNSDVWENASDSDKLKALYQVTRAIDRLNFSGEKAEEDQLLEFPRDDDTATPVNIEYAAYEEAIMLLDGTNVASELADLNVTSHAFASVRTTYDRTFASDHVRAGIMSPIAWIYLSPYLRDGNQVNISRVS